MRILIAAAAASLLAAPAAAETFQTQAVSIEDAAAQLTVIPENRATIAVEIQAGARLAAPQARMNGERLVIDGGLDNRFRGCTTNLSGRTQVRIARLGNVRREDLPRIILRVPGTLDLSAAGAIFTTIGASAGGDVSVSGCGDTSVGATTGALEITQNGSGNVEVARVGGALEAALNGSGSLNVESVRTVAQLRLNGSGDLQVGDVGGGLDAIVAGSGSLRSGAVGANAEIALNGSGNLNAGAVRGSLNADLRGSGSMRVASVTGDSAELDLTSSGSLIVSAGQVQRLRARSTGSGAIRYGGSAGVTSATLSGSGSIIIAEGGRVDQLIDSGSGSINIGR